jgi:hypothetical protein
LHWKDEIGHQAAEQAEQEGDLTEAFHCSKNLDAKPAVCSRKKAVCPKNEGRTGTLVTPVEATKVGIPLAVAFSAGGDGGRKAPEHPA